MEWTVSTFVSLLAALIPFAAIAYQFYNPPSVASIDETNEAEKKEAEAEKQEEKKK